ncbi:uncharacterized protein LOC131990158 [Centropristis striata]|uniref:uncharacterized protein LOC131990158 n=1 Tax=Centropristis striata TaxID=184440 RepID=UPI0027DFA29C|nr:uncharacterized protein LOC131990158 [Centropristis striata]
MSALAGAVLAYNKTDMMLLVQAVRSGNGELYARYSDEEMIAFLKPHQESALVIESIIAEFRGPAGLDIDGIHLFKSTEAVDAHWATASKYLGCMQDPPGIQLYVSVKVVVLNGVRLKYKCRRGSNSLEGLHAHLYNAIPSEMWDYAIPSIPDGLCCAVEQPHGITPGCWWSGLADARQIQRINQQAEVLFGKEHVLEPNFAAPMPVPDAYEHPDEEELLNVEQAVCQCTSFTAKNFYVQKVEEEQSREEEEESAEKDEDEEMADEGLGMSAESEEDPIDSFCRNHAILTKAEQVEEDSPALQDVLMTERHLHLPGIEEVLLELVDNSDRHLVPADLRQKIVTTASSLHEHDKTAARFVKKYESRWGYTLFGWCLGADTHETRAAQKTKFGWMRFPQAAQVTKDSRLLYLLIKMLKNRPPCSQLSSPSKVVASIKGQHKRIADRLRDDAILCGLAIPLPNVNAKSISTFIAREEKKANYRATVMPRVTPHQKVL